MKLEGASPNAPNFLGSPEELPSRKPEASLSHNFRQLKSALRFFSSSTAE